MNRVLDAYEIINKYEKNNEDVVRNQIKGKKTQSISIPSLQENF